MTISREPDNRQGLVYFECDGKRCAEVVETGTNDFLEAKEELRKAGWQTYRNDDIEAWEHYCPEHRR